MKIPLNKSFFITLALVIITALLAHYSALWRMDEQESAGDMASTKKPLYWVAPMDPKYKRDNPGKSPMGMELIPVYEEAGSNNDVGTVTISPDVVNNLGVRIAPVARGHLNLTISTVGYVQYDEDRLVHIHPRVEGWIEKLHVKAAGDPVIQGEPFYALYSPTLVNAQEELLLALKRNNPTLITAAMERLSALQVPQSDISQLKKSGKVSQSITIKAPQSGVLDNLNIREGMFVKPGMEMMSIGQLEHIWVIGEVFERQAASVRVGDAVRMRLDYLPGREWSGRVDYIYPTLNAKTRTAQVRVHFDNSDRYLKPGMFAQIAIATRQLEDALLIPREALIRTGSQSRVVLAMGEGRFKSIAVEVGRIGESQVEILSGLKAGERIVSSAQFLIDSESSKTSDFQRMNHEDDPPMESADSAWVAARIENLMVGHRMVTLAHEAIPSWQWPAMEMDFSVDDSVDLSRLVIGMGVHVEIRREGNNYLISQIRRPDAEPGGVQSTDGMEHSDHESISHQEMNQPEMDQNQDQREPGQ